MHNTHIATNDTLRTDEKHLISLLLNQTDINLTSTGEGMQESPPTDDQGASGINFRDRIPYDACELINEVLEFPASCTLKPGL